MTRSIIVDDVLPHSPAKVWKALTTPDFIAAWLMPNDFKPEVGHGFTFRTRPIGDWDGVVHCVVTACEPNRLLRYTWKGGSDNNPGYGKALDSIVTWELTPVEGGTRLHMEHSGFVSPGNDFAFDAMSGGWGKIVPRIAEVIAQKDG